MKKNPLHQQQHFYQNNVVIPQSVAASNNTNLYQQNYYQANQHLVGQQVYYTNMMNKNQQLQQQQQRNISQRLPNNQPFNNYQQIPQFNYYQQQQQQQPQYTNERRNSYHSSNQPLSNLSNYSKYKPQLQKQISLPEQIELVTTQLKSTVIIEEQIKPSFINELSPVYELKLDVVNKAETSPQREEVITQDELLLTDLDEDILDKQESNLLTSASSSESSLTNTSNSSISHKTLSDLVQKPDSYKDKSDYFRHLVFAIDQLYPDCKWPLHCTWTFWFIKHDSNKTWSDNLKTVSDVSYVEDFWSTINYLLNKSNLLNQGDFTFFKKGIKPEWEDEQNKSGGCWLYQVNNQQFKKVNDLWLETLLALIGDNYCDRDLINQIDSSYFDKKSITNKYSDHICDFLSGTILMHRGKNDKLALWTKNYKDDLTTRLIGKIWKNVMKLSENFTINFEVIIHCFFRFVSV